MRLFLKGRLVPDQEIDDVVQQLFMRLMGLDRLEDKMSESTGSNRAYLLTMANNLVVDRLRKSMLRKAHSEVEHDHDGGRVDERTPEQIVVAQLELEAIWSVIMDMRPKWRRAFVLHRFRNMSYGDIALHMGVTVKQVEYFISQAMKRIRKARAAIETAGQEKC